MTPKDWDNLASKNYKTAITFLECGNTEAYHRFNRRAAAEWKELEAQEAKEKRG